MYLAEPWCDLFLMLNAWPSISFLTCVICPLIYLFPTIQGGQTLSVITQIRHCSCNSLLLHSWLKPSCCGTASLTGAQRVSSTCLQAPVSPAQPASLDAARKWLRGEQAVVLLLLSLQEWSFLFLLPVARLSPDPIQECTCPAAEELHPLPPSI